MGGTLNKSNGKNILLINWQDRTNPYYGGAEVHLHEIFGRLVRNYGYRATLICTSYPGAMLEDELDGIRIIRHDGPRNYFNFHVRGMYKRLLQEGEKFDLLIEDYNKLPFFSSSWARCPVMLQVHHFFGKTIYFEVPWPIATFIYMSEKFALWRYRKMPFICVSESTEKDLLDAGVKKENIRIVYNGIQTDLFYPDDSVEKASQPTIVYLGRIKAYKRVDVLIRAMPAIRERIPGARLVIIGSGDGLPKLRELADLLSLTEEIVHFAGFVSEEEKVRHLRRAWVAVNTSPKEGWGIVGMEAQACGTPAVVSDAPGLRESILDSETGYLFRFGDERQLTEKVTLLLKDSELRRKMGKAATEWARKFTWDKAAADTHNVISELLDGKFGAR